MNFSFAASIRRALRVDPAAHESVHFHFGAGGRPYVCDVQRCDSPTLTPGEMGR